ncbi:hypothetical protein DFS34DRAFT_611311 [Phlyctochytrium arcticum]|nr:hypothetical protein DFS34DRAFT_611311 [Phlyctochytrium arcticum]
MSSPTKTARVHFAEVLFTVHPIPPIPLPLPAEYEEYTPRPRQRAQNRGWSLFQIFLCVFLFATFFISGAALIVLAILLSPVLILLGNTLATFMIFVSVIVWARRSIREMGAKCSDVQPTTSAGTNAQRCVGPQTISPATRARRRVVRRQV